MSEPTELLFEENQYQGLNKHSLVRRMLLSVFCFVAYYWSENPKPVTVSIIHIGEYPGDVRYGELFFVLGLAVLGLSVVLLFVRHMRTIVSNEQLVIRANFPPRVTTLQLADISDVRKVQIRPSIFNRPVFQLQTKGKVRFYTWGNEMVELTLKNGKIYRIGTQRGAELVTLLKNQII
jgi:hypothetical protein